MIFFEAIQHHNAVFYIGFTKYRSFEAALGELNGMNGIVRYNANPQG
jgi:hypothetical protein